MNTATQIFLIDEAIDCSDEDYKVKFIAAKKIIKTKKLLRRPFNLHEEIRTFLNNHKEALDIWLTRIKDTAYYKKNNKNVLKLEYYMMNAHRCFYRIPDNSWIRICIGRA